ncbi:MAG: D-Ala-D-Ala carboxypeptidase family metallohydrolase [Gammaproteobacteria bacterium]
MAKILDWNDYDNFEKHEFDCHCGCGRADMTPEFMQAWQDMRTFLGFGFKMSSGFRCEAHDLACGGKGAHPTGDAGDVLTFGMAAQKLVTTAPAFGFNRIGVSQNGPKVSRFIHLDRVALPDYPSPWIWSY